MRTRVSAGRRRGWTTNRPARFAFSRFPRQSNVRRNDRCPARRSNAEQECFALYRTSLDVAVAALQGAGRPEEALQFLRDAAQLDTSLHVGLTSYTLPVEIIGKRWELDDLADARAKEHRSTLLAQAAHLGAASDERIEHLVGLAIRAELREEDTFSNGEHVYRVARLSEFLALEADCSD